MKEIELTPEIIERLGLDSSAEWGEIRADESGDIYVQGVCNVQDEDNKCPVAKTIVYNVETGEIVSDECPEPSDPNSKLCYWGGRGELPIGEE